jgi:hypothetical protein
MIGKRTNFDFSKHNYIISKVENDDFSSYSLKREGYEKMYSIKFTNIDGVCLVTGDYGNIVFCRTFHPSKGEGVSDGYWLEKLKINSEQEPYLFDSEQTEKEILELLNDDELLINKFGEDRIFEIKEYFENLLNYVYDEIEYNYYAFREKPYSVDYEDIPYVKKVKNNINFIFDAFDYLCEKA